MEQKLIVIRQKLGGRGIFPLPPSPAALLYFLCRCNQARSSGVRVHILTRFIPIVKTFFAYKRALLPSQIILHSGREDVSERFKDEFFEKETIPVCFRKFSKIHINLVTNSYDPPADIYDALHLHTYLCTVWPEPICIKVSSSRLLLPQHQSIYLRGPESASTEIHPFRSHFIKFSKTVFYEVNLTSQH